MTEKQVLSEMQQIRNNASYFQSAVYRYKTFMSAITDEEKEVLRRNKHIVELNDLIVELSNDIANEIKAL